MMFNNPQMYCRPSLLHWTIVLVLACVVTGCAVAPRRSVNTSLTPPSPSVEKDTLAQLIAAEFALQTGDLFHAAQGYGQATQTSQDPLVAEQAARLAAAIKDWSLAAAAMERWQQLAPNAVNLIQMRAWIALAQGQDDEAYKDLVILLDKDDEKGWTLASQVLIGAGGGERVLALLGRLATPTRLGEKEEIWLAVSQLAFKLGDKVLARHIAAQAVQRFHGSDAYAWSARLALDAGDKSGARAAYAEALKRNAKSIRLRSGYAGLLAELGDNAQAARILAEGTQDDTTYGARAAYMARADDKAAMMLLYREIKNDPSDRSAQRIVLLGQLAELLNLHEEALVWYQGIAIGDSLWIEAQIRIAVILDLQGKVDQSLMLLHELQAQAGDDAKLAGEIYLLEAELLVQHAQNTEAFMVYERGLTALPDDTRLLYARALFAITQKNMPLAEQDLRRILALKPNDVQALNALGYTLADYTERTEEALILIQKALTQKPDDASIIDSWGWVQYRLGNLSEAAKQLRRAYEKQPDAEIAAHLGEVLWVMGEHEEARRIWGQGQKKDPKNKVLLETITRLSS